MQRKQTWFYRLGSAGRFLLLFLPIISMSLIISFYIYYVERSAREKLFVEQELNLLEHLSEDIGKENRVTVSDLFSISEFHELLDLINGESVHQRPFETIARDWLALSKRKQVYDQIRYLDESGQEIVRINYNQGNPVLVPPEQLQNKANRYYFATTIALQKDEVYISPFDLNMEQGEIETPVNPTLRYATPVFGRDGKSRGIVTINYMGSDLLNHLREAGRHVMLLNSEGYWMLGPDKQREWGDILGNDEMMQKYDNEAWRKISTREKGSFFQDGKLYSFLTILPIKNALLTENIHRDGFKTESGRFWKIVSVLEATVVDDAVRNLRRTLVVINLAFAILMFLAITQVLIVQHGRRRDFSLLQESEIRFRQAEGIAHLGCWEWTFVDNKIFWSEGYFHLFGYCPAKVSPSYKAFIARVHPESRKHIRNELKKRLQGEAGSAIDYCIVLPDGTQRILREEADVKLKAPGQPLRILGTVRDITRQRAMEDDLLAAKNLAEKSALAKSSFLANMSHEIRTPMNAILGLSHLTLGTELTPKQFEYLGKIDNSAKNLLKIIDDTLDYSKIEAGKLILEETLFDLDKLMVAVFNVVSVKAAEKDVDLLFRIDPNAPMHLIGDPVRLQQVLVNLAGNAVKFTEKGEVVISVEPEAPRRANIVCLKFAVRDTGIGISEQQIDKLFDAFSQADSSTTRKYGGTGLGLTICQNLLRLMESELQVTSIVGAGSEFSFTLPCTIGYENERTFQVDDLAGKRTLVVDDSATPREILRELLESFSLDVMTAESGVDALHKMKAAELVGHPFEIVFLDWRMPEMDGIQTYHRIIGGDFSFVPRMLLVSAYDYESVRAPDFFDQYINKPTTPEILMNKLLSVYRTVPLEKNDDNPSDDAKQIMFAGERILLAEDNDINQLITSELLSKAGLDVVVANDGCEAFDMIQSGEHFDLVLMDMQMPRMDGLTAIRKIRELPGCGYEDLPVLALTAHAMLDDCAHSFDAGANSHLTKPICPETLYAALLKWLEKPASATSPEFQMSETTTPKVMSLPAALPGLNLQDALALQGGDADFILRIARKFRCNHAETVVDIRQALSCGDRGAATRLAHTMKSVGGYVGANELQKLATRLEEVLKSGEQETDALLDLFEAEMNVVMTSLAKLEQPT